jgi:hypothetical protein
MSTLIPNNQIRMLTLGSPVVSKATGTLAASTVALFTISGGLVVVTSLIGVVTTAITVANSYKLQSNPTTGTTTDICAATDLGTVDTPVGDMLTPAGASGIIRGGVASIDIGAAVVAPIGQIEHVSTGTDGAITWYCTWYPYDGTGALVAA